MTTRAILFDLYGTLIDIDTDESLEEIYRSIAHYLTYHGVYLHRGRVQQSYYQIMKQQKEARGEEHPEIDVEAIWNAFLKQEGMESADKRAQLALILAQLYRGISRKRLQLYPGVRTVLDELRDQYRLAVITDAQPCFALPEIQAVGLSGYFDPVVISAPYGYRKPDRRLIESALDILQLTPAEVVYVGNDMFRDIYGASRLGIKTVFVDSNQGTKSYENVVPDYFAPRFEDVIKGVAALAQSEPATPF